MRRAMYGLIVLAVSAGLCLTGCKPVSSTTPSAAIAPGATSAFDSVTYEALASLHGFVASLKTQIAQGTFTPTPTQKRVLNQMIVDLDTAQTLYAAYHAGSATQAAMQTALTAVQNDQSAYSTAVTSGAK